MMKDNTTITMPCIDCNEGYIFWNAPPHKPVVSDCMICGGEGTVEYSAIYDCIQDAIEDYPHAIMIDFDFEDEEDGGEEK